MKSTREMWLILRARDEASATLRRAARGIGGMQDTGVLQRQRAQVQTQIATAQRLRDQALLQQKEIETGSRRTQQLINEGNHTKRILTLNNQIKDIESAREAILKRRYADQNALSKAERLSARREKLGLAPEAVLRGSNQAELNRAILGAKAGIRSANKDLKANTGDLQINAQAQSNLIHEATRLTQTEIRQAEAARNAGRAAEEYGMRIGTLTAREAELDAAIAARPRENLQAAARSVANLGRSLVFAGGAATIMFGIMAHGAATFNQQATLAATQTGAIGSGANVIIRNAGRIQSAILDQMRAFPSSSEDMTKAIYDIYSSMNISFGKGLELLKIFNQGVVAGGGPAVISLTDLSTALITLANNWKLNTNSMATWRKLMASTLATVRFGRMTVQQYTQTMNQLAPAFRGAHLSIQQMNAAIAFQTRLQPSQRFASTGLARMVEQLQRIAPALRNNFGVDITNARGNLLNLDVVFQRLIKRFPELLTSGSALEGFFKKVGGSLGTVQARRAFRAFVQNLNDYKKVLKSVSGDQNEFNRSLEAMQKTGGIQWAVFINQMKALALEIGSFVLPIFIKLGKGISFLIAAFDSLPTPVKRAIAVFAATLSVLTLFTGALLGIGGLAFGAILGLEGLATGIGLVGTAIAEATSAMAGFEALGIIAAPEVFLPILAVGALAAAFIKWHKPMMDAIRDSTLLRAALENLTPARVIILVANLARQILDLVKAYARFGSALITAIGHIDDFAAKIPGVTKLVDIISNAVSKLAGVWEKLAHSPPVRLVINVIENIPGGGKAAKVAGIGARIIGDVLNPIRGATEIFNAAAKGLEAANKSVEDTINKHVSKPAFRGIHDQRIERFQYEQARKMRGLSPLTFSDEDYIAEIRKLAKLKQAIEEAPSYAKKLAALKAYDMELGRATRKETDVQKKYQEELLNSSFATSQVSPQRAVRMFSTLRRLQAQFAIEPTLGLATAITKLEDKISKASPAVQKYLQQLEQSLGPVKVISDRQAMSLAAQAAKLKKAFDDSPSTANWNAWYSVQKQYTTMATADQQQLGDDMVAANQAAVDKMQQNFDTLLNNVRSQYDKLRGDLQSAFGTLGSGPVVTGLSNQVKKITDDAKAQSKSLRDQAKALQDAQDKADDVDAKTGNLIDKGWLANPADTKKQTDAAIKSINDQADAIDEAAQKAADKLQTRIDAKKFTPKEILADLKAQVKAFNNWNRDLDRIGKRGGPAALVQQLRDLGPEFDNMLKGILKMSPAQFRDYVATFNKAQKTIDNQAMKQLKAQLKLYKKHGMDIAQAIADGIGANDKALRRALIKLIEETFPGVQVPNSDKVTTKGVKPKPGARTTQGVHNTTVHYHYHAGPKGMSPETYFQKMHFRQRNQRRC